MHPEPSDAREPKYIRQIRTQLCPGFAFLDFLSGFGSCSQLLFCWRVVAEHSAKRKFVFSWKATHYIQYCAKSDLGPKESWKIHHFGLEHKVVNWTFSWYKNKIKKGKEKTFRVEQCKQLSENFPKDAPKIFAFEHYLNLIIVVTNHKDAPAALDIV